MMILMHWRLLVAVADSGNISKAAQRHGISQSGAASPAAGLLRALLRARAGAASPTAPESA